MYNAKQVSKASLIKRLNIMTIMRNPIMKKSKIQNNMISLTALKAGLRRKEFFVHYQPQINLKTQKVIGFEALIRWQHPQLGLLLPGRFLNQLHTTALAELDHFVLQETGLAMQQHKKNIKFSVNYAPSSLESPHFLSRFQQIIEKTKSNPSRLILELVETNPFQNIEKMAILLKTVTKMGVRIALDDFGTGFNNLAYLILLPCHILKIDQCFIKTLFKQQKSKQIIQHVLQLAKKLGLDVIAEGIETKAQYNFLLQANCPTGQGFYFKNK